MSPDAATHERYMGRCIELARGALATNDAPVGAVVVSEEQIVGEGVEGVKAHSDVTAHAEIAALRAACRRLGTLDLSGCTLYTSVEPCVMCAYAIRLARVAAVVTGAGAADAECAVSGWTVLTSADVLLDRPLPLVVRGVMATESLALLSAPKP